MPSVLTASARSLACSAVAAAAVLLSVGCVHRHDPLFEAFQHPAPNTRPFVRWWWNGGRVDAQEIARELDVMDAAGMGGVEINTIAMPEGASAQSLAAHPALPWLSPGWNAMLATAVRGARERGMSADLVVGSGWPFGGRFLSVDEQTMRVHLVKRRLEGPSSFTCMLDELDTAPLTAEQATNAREEVPPARRKLVFLRLLPVGSRTGDFSPGVDLMPEVDAEGAVSFQVPPGEHVLYAGTWQSGFTHVKLGAPGADGPVVNHFDAVAVRKYLDHMSEALAPTFGGDLGSGIRAAFVDSLELDRANWTADLPDEFRRRRGYDILPYLPFILDSGDGELSASFRDTVRRARHDFNETLVELFEERFVSTYVAWATDHGVEARMQAYGREVHPLHGSMGVALPEGETWLWADEENPERTRVESTVVNKYVSSAANLTGKRLRSFEAMTNTVPVFRATLQDLKRGMDASVISGLNHPILHGFNYSPPDAGFPGWVRFGSYFNERNPWWPHVHRFSDYAARLGTVMRHSEAQARVAVLAPRADEWAQHGLLYQPFPEPRYPWYQYELVEALHQAGYNVDFISGRVLEEGRSEHGQFLFGPRAYDLILTEDVGALEPAAATALAGFVSGGGKLVIIGQRPVRSPGLHRRQARDQQVKRAMSRMASASGGQVLHVPAPALEREAGSEARAASLLRFASETMRAVGLRPDVVFAQPTPNVSQVFHLAGARHIYFVVNRSEDTSAEVAVGFPRARGAAYRWDAESGSRRRLAMTASNETSFSLGPVESALIVFEPDERPRRAGRAAAPHATQKSFEVEGPWRLSLHVAASTRVVEKELHALMDLSQAKEDADLSGFGGVAVYRTTFSGAPGRASVLDLGEVHGVSEVWLNGTPLGVRWWGRHTYDVAGLVESGDNRIEVKVSTVLVNHMKHLKDDPTAQRLASWAPPIPMGMVGPVRLVGIDPSAR